MLTFISFLIVIGICVISHEGGHFLAAKLCKVDVFEFSFGMGPLLFKRKIGETDFSIRILPFGGYVKMAGEDQPEDIANAKEKEISNFCDKSPLQRIFILAAGAAVNLFLACLLTAIYLSFGGVYDVDRAVIGEVIDNTPAYECGIRPNDKILSVDGEEVKRWGDISKYIQSSLNENVVIDYERDGNRFTLNVKIPYNETYKQKLFGVKPAIIHYPFYRSLPKSVKFLLNESKSILSSIPKIFTSFGKENVSGPLGIAVMSGEAVKSGMLTFMAFLGIINLNLGLLNLMPFPALDGGRIVFVLFELITRRKFPAQMEAYVHYFGLMLLLALIVYVTGLDFSRILR